MKATWVGLATLFLASTMVVGILGCAGTEAQTPKGVVQLLPRGGIPAVFEPEFVAAQVAQIPDQAWVLGLFLEGEARAYSLNLLNGHEIVNDRVAGRPIAAVW